MYTKPSIDIKAHTLPVCSIEMISSVCSQLTIPTSPPGPTISTWVLSEEGLGVCPGTNDFKCVGPCSLLCLECLIDLEVLLAPYEEFGPVHSAQYSPTP